MKIYRPTETETDAATAALITRQPSEAARFAKAAAIVLAGAISHTDATGWTVASQDRKAAGKAYRVTPTSCECEDHKRHANTSCKHMDAMRIMASILAAKLDAAMPMPPEDIYARLVAQGHSEAVAADVADEASIDPVLGDEHIFIVPATQSNQRHLFDRQSGDELCTVQRNPNGAWRPCTAEDTVAWARWLGAQQGEKEGAVVAAQPVTPDPAPRTLQATPAPDYEARAKLAARMARERATTASPYKYDQRQAAKYGHAPVLQLTHEANQRRAMAQA